jgi:serine/threonine-protein kinase HipA
MYWQISALSWHSLQSQEAKMGRELSVFLKDELVGRLEQDNSGDMRFCYDEAWLSSQSPVALSASLPLRQEVFGRNECRPFFAGLLPEENSRKLIAKAFGVSDRNDFALLAKVGAECAGAVSLLPPGELPISGDPQYRQILLGELAEKFEILKFHPLLAGEERIRLSLAGAQGKLAVAMREGNFFLSLDGSPSSHILKPQSPHFAGLVENEFFCMRLAHRTGLEVASVEIGTAGETRFLQIERFDRLKLADCRWQRIHQEDFCQAMGIPPELKYQQEGGPNLKKCFELVREVSAVPALDVLRLFDAVVFNFLIGNSDAHGKNFSFLYDDGSAKLAPLYDLVCTQAYQELAPDLVMKIGDEKKPKRISSKNWRKFFKDAGIGQAQAERRLLALVNRIQDETQMMFAEGHSGSDQVSPIILEHCRNLLAQEWGKE